MKIIFIALLAFNLTAWADTSDHHYVLKEGYEYGYVRAITPEEAQQGMKSQEILMFRYAGIRDGIYQVFTVKDDTVSVLECLNPCEFIKSIYFYADGESSVTRMQATPGTVAMGVLTDAFQGKLEPVVAIRKGKKLNVWYDEKHGITTLPVTKN